MIAGSSCPWWVTPFVVLLVAAIPAGIGLAIWLDNTAWLALSVGAFIIIFAG